VNGVAAALALRAALATECTECTAWDENPEAAAKLAGGDRKVQGVLVGLVMQKSLGRADPRRVNQLLAERAGT